MAGYRDLPRFAKVFGALGGVGLRFAVLRFREPSIHSINVVDVVMQGLEVHESALSSDSEFGRFQPLEAPENLAFKLPK